MAGIGKNRKRNDPSLSQRELRRRDLLTLFGIGATTSLVRSPLALLATSLLEGALGRSMAFAQGIKPRKYVFVQLQGAPPHWAYDLFLTPYSKVGFVPSLGIGTQYTGTSSYSDVAYSTIALKGINVPPMWQFQLPRAGGGTRPMSDLLDNLLSIRGMTTNVDSHPTSQTLQVLPNGSSFSTPALTADYSSAPIKAINALGTGNDGTRFVWRSRNKTNYVALSSYGNMIRSLIQPFVTTAPTSFLAKKNMLSTSLQNATAALNGFAQGRHPTAAELAVSHADAERLMKESFGDLTVIWDTLRNKYLDLIARAMTPGEIFIGFTDKPIGVGGVRPKSYALNGTIVNNVDLRTMVDDNSTIQHLAEHFALAEYVLLNNLSESVSINPYSLLGVRNISGSATRMMLHGFDEHFTGKMPSLLLNFNFYRGLSACLLELMDRLKGAGMYNETLINVSGEFGRSPLADGSGSDHGWQAGNVSLYSGIIRGPIVLGNIYNSSPSTSYPKGWGYGREVKTTGGGVFQNGGQLDPGNIAATIAEFLRVPSPIQARTKLVSISGSTVTPLIELAKQS